MRWRVRSVFNMDEPFKTILGCIYVTKGGRSYIYFLNRSDTMPPGGTVNESPSHESPAHWCCDKELHDKNKLDLTRAAISSNYSKSTVWYNSQVKWPGWIFICFSCAWASNAIFWVKICMCYFINIESQFRFNWPASVLAVSVAVVFVWSIAAIWHGTREKPIQCTCKRTEEQSTLSAGRGEPCVFHPTWADQYTIWSTEMNTHGRKEKTSAKINSFISGTSETRYHSPLSLKSIIFSFTDTNRIF